MTTKRAYQLRAPSQWFPTTGVFTVRPQMHLILKLSVPQSLLHTLKKAFSSVMGTGFTSAGVYQQEQRRQVQPQEHASHPPVQVICG